MKKDKLKKLAEDPRFISGIYNYCDNWCERCSFTARCLNFAMREADEDDPDSQNIESEQFWHKIDEGLSLAIELLEEMAEERGIDLDAVESENVDKEFEQSQEKAGSHELSHSALDYIDLVDAWFDTNQDLFEQREKELKTELAIGIAHAKLYNEAKSIIDATEVIHWYQPQIYVKLMRTLAQFNDDDDPDEIQNDTNGSAKVALIAIDRSIGAWARFHDHFPDQSDSILDILLLLDRLRRKMAIAFPHARDFKRPGFDD